MCRVGKRCGNEHDAQAGGCDEDCAPPRANAYETDRPDEADEAGDHRHGPDVKERGSRHVAIIYSWKAITRS